jgi:N6-L-threonylcarbamoyladenine synthase
MNAVLGIDTSCYTTSMALVDFTGNILFNRQVLLEVPLGERGLQQSKAVFQHLRNLPGITCELRKEKLPGVTIAAVSASTRPRPVEGSYMPVFMVSEWTGQMLSDVLNVPFYKVSHQENHIMAGLHTAGGPNEDTFLVIHLSGGTTELLIAGKDSSGFSLKIIGCTQDLHAGQFVDRIGVALDLPFPAGPHLEQLALGTESGITLKSFSKDLQIGFSGAETQAQRLIEKGCGKKELAAAVYSCLASTLSGWIFNAVAKTGIKEILLVGGVSSSGLLKSKLNLLVAQRDPDIHLYYTDPLLSRDSAVGTALLALRSFLKENEHNR